MIKNGECASTCVNLPGSYKCSCNNGFVLGLDEKTCIDTDECNLNANICKGGICSNTIGTYKCICQSGLVQSSDGKHCIGIQIIFKKNVRNSIEHVKKNKEKNIKCKKKPTLRFLVCKRQTSSSKWM